MRRNCNWNKNWRRQTARSLVSRGCSDKMFIYRERSMKDVIFAINILQLLMKVWSTDTLLDLMRDFSSSVTKSYPKSTLSSLVSVLFINAEDLLRKSIWWKSWNNFLQFSIKTYVVGTETILTRVAVLEIVSTSLRNITIFTQFLSHIDPARHVKSYKYRKNIKIIIPTIYIIFKQSWKVYELLSQEYSAGQL